MQDEIQRIAAPLGGEVGVAAWRLDRRDPRVLVRAGERFPMASTFDIAVAGALLAKIGAGALTLDRMLTVDPKSKVESGLIAEVFIHPGVSLSVQNLLELMLTRSDDTAIDVLTAVAGGPKAVARSPQAAPQPDRDPGALPDRRQPAQGTASRGHEDGRRSHTMQFEAATPCTKFEISLGCVVVFGSGDPPSPSSHDGSRKLAMRGTTLVFSNADTSVSDDDGVCVQTRSSPWYHPEGMAAAKGAGTDFNMLTISAFLFVTSSVLTSVWWACKDEESGAASSAAEMAGSAGL